MDRAPSPHLVRLAAVAALCLASPLAAQALPPDEAAALGLVHRYAGPVDAADVMGGYRSDAILVRLAPGQELRPLAKGLVLVGPDGRDHRGIAATLAAFGAATSRPAFAVPPRDPALDARFGLSRWHRIALPEGSDTPALVAALRAAGGPVERADLEGIGGILGVEERWPNDPSFGLLYGLHNSGQVVQGVPGVPDADLDLPAAWALHVGGPDVTIAIIDTGVSYSHPDLNDKLVPGRNTINDNANADDSWLISHGTHCAGIAAAESDNGIGVTGVSWGARIMPVKVLTTLGSGSEADVAEGIVWAADNGAHVLSMSLGFPGLSPMIEDAIGYAAAAGKVIVAASGNTPGAAIGAPAVYAPVIAVGATDNRDQIASFTTTGPELDVTAPGVETYSTYDTLFQANTYAYQSGTSMACPHVAGLAALVWSANRSLTAAEVRSIIESTADDRGAAGWDPIFGHGRVNAFAAVTAALAPACDVADLDCDGTVGGTDLAALLAAWGAAGDPADLDGDGTVGATDLAILLAAWG